MKPDARRNRRRRRRSVPQSHARQRRADYRVNDIARGDFDDARHNLYQTALRHLRFYAQKESRFFEQAIIIDAPDIKRLSNSLQWYSYASRGDNGFEKLTNQCR